MCFTVSRGELICDANVNGISLFVSDDFERKWFVCTQTIDDEYILIKIRRVIASRSVLSDFCGKVCLTVRRFIRVNVVSYEQLNETKNNNVISHNLQCLYISPIPFQDCARYFEDITLN